MANEIVTGLASFFSGIVASVFAMNSTINKKIIFAKKEVLEHCDLKYALKEDVSQIKITLAEIKKDIQRVLEFVSNYENNGKHDK